MDYRGQTAVGPGFRGRARNGYATDGIQNRATFPKKEILVDLPIVYVSDCDIMFKRGASVILFGNRDADHVLIEPTSKVSSGWRTANIAVQCGVWSGRYSGQFLVGELNRFGKEIEYLAEHLKPKAALNSAEHYLQMTLVHDAHGHVQAHGSARDRVGAKSSLEFDFEIDPARLQEVASALIQADPQE